MGLWRRWVAFCFRPMDSRPLALLRIGVALCITLDLLRVAQIGMVHTMFSSYAQGGLSQVQDRAWVLPQLVGDERAAVWAYGVTLVCMPLVALGLFTRPAIVVGVLAYAQLGHGYPPGDRAIDRVLRMVLLFLLFSGVHRRFALSNVLFKRPALETLPSWSADLIRFSLVLIYMSAGLGKIMQQPRWMAMDGLPVLYRVVTDPLAAHLDPVFWMAHPWPFRLGGWGTIVMEVGAFLIFTRLRVPWAIFGIGMHLGIAASMELGMFSWGMLALYPVLLTPLITRALDRFPATANRGNS